MNSTTVQNHFSDARAGRLVAEIDTAAVQHNLAQVRQRTPAARVMAVIKANGYGHGMLEMAEALAQAHEFAVSSVDEVLQLRAAGVTKPVTTLSAQVSAAQLEQLDERTKLTIFDATQLDALESLSLPGKLSVWLKVDSGMGRLGFSPEQVPEVFARLQANRNIVQVGLMSHLANADHPQRDATEQQFAIVDGLSEQFDFAEVSLLNSAGILNYPEMAADVVRPGLMLYGASPLAGRSGADLGLQAAMTMRAALLSVRDVPAGTPIGYGSEYCFPARGRIGIVPCGYGDGYLRSASPGACVLVDGQRAPLLGRVSMDMIAIDLSDLSAHSGDEVILWGPNHPVEDVATAAGTIAWELLAGLTSRPHREYQHGKS